MNNVKKKRKIERIGYIRKIVTITLTQLDRVCISSILDDPHLELHSYIYAFIYFWNSAIISLKSVGVLKERKREGEGKR